VTRPAPLTLAALLLAGTPLGADPGAEALRVRASSAVAPCVAAAAREFHPVTASVAVGGFRDLHDADVFVGADVEVTRALESGGGVIRSEADVARIPWVLVVGSGNPLALRGTGDLAHAGGDVWVLGGLAASQARRVLAEVPPERLKESEDAGRLRDASPALVPLSLAGAGERLAVDMPALVARAVVAAGTKQPEAAMAFVAFLASEPGQRAFAKCGERREK
jgi:accessory colonization factor AcfC